VEIEPPMPVTLSPDDQRQWLRDHAQVAEGNAVFGQMADACTEPHGYHGPKWLAERSWCALYEEHLEQAARNGYALDGQRFTAQIAGRTRTFITTFSGVVTDATLQRVWCVARDVSEIVDLNTRLLRERERLRAYAHQLVTAEERARRATAVDLHDGIGQSLTGLAMSLEVARMQAPQIGELLDDVRVNLRKVQEHTRSMIADLSPPGLYELGLAPALQWLAVHFRSQEKLRVQLSSNVIEESINMELRVLIFKLVRELLRNVVKHAGVESATVRVQGDRTRVTVEVEDTGRGFEWQIEMFGSRPGGFGLWSISDRVGDVGGEFTVDTAPGRGARFKLVFPLERPGHAVSSRA
jgi:signal transduction histidine kinase